MYKIEFILSGLLFFSSAQADLYKCIQDDGSVIFSDKVCGQDAYKMKKPSVNTYTETNITIEPEDTFEELSQSQIKQNIGCTLTQKRMAKRYFTSVEKYLSKKDTRLNPNHYLNSKLSRQATYSRNAGNAILHSCENGYCSNSDTNKANSKFKSSIKTLSKINDWHKQNRLDKADTIELSDRAKKIFNEGESYLNKCSVKLPTPAPTVTTGVVPSSPPPIGLIDPYTGKFYPRAGEGYVDPQTGTYYPDVGPGVVNSKTGQFIPTH